jgi:hypothetical protein
MIEVDTTKVLEDREMARDLTLRAGDLVFVSRSRIAGMGTFAGTVLPNLGWLAVMFR